jgi:hypothetical protein
MDLSTTDKRPSLGASSVDHTTFDGGQIVHGELLFGCRVHPLVYLIVDARDGQESVVACASVR